MFPGGGYVMDTFEANAVVCSRIAKFSCQKIILVNYRLVPENPMPTPISDVLDATKLKISGFSAGVHCAAVISHLSRNNKQIRIDHQILLNGADDALLNKRDYAKI